MRTIRNTVFFFFFFITLISACSSQQEDTQHAPEADPATELSDAEALSRFTGVWITPETYQPLESARLRLRLIEAEMRVSGSLQYRDLTDIQEAAPTPPQLFMSAVLSGSSSARTLTAEIRNESGDILGDARLALREDQLHIQLLNPIPGLSAIFVLEREG
ncbi:hypothetical protein CYPRO_2866 [Cyclonatronum proteinivorum]|uniref:Lipocalin-like domain-containing protein n=1 Tax=Cyclonatronum proteinivorum TaxID=1457365 RepID=A0A345UNQ2_9BACT|nr:hypothetical protein [Cyclonatronum proteinivorum]AXJ02104.1 hypothetical protein CYPRO_2866 [Cyclonatronum proteinivorum]